MFKLTRAMPVTGVAGCPSPLRNVPNEVLNHIFVLCSCSQSVGLPYDQGNVPCQVILSHVCSRWRRVTLSTGALWSKVMIPKSGRDFNEHYTHCLFLYRMWIGRAGAHPLTVNLNLCDHCLNVRNIFQDFVLPFQIKMLNIRLNYSDFPVLSYFPTFNVEEFAISLTQIVQRIENFVRPPFMDRTREICLAEDILIDNSEQFQAILKELSLPWHQLRSLNCYCTATPLSSLLHVLQQAQSLEWCHLTIYKFGSGPLVAISLPSLRRLTLTLRNVHPDIVIPLFTTPNLTALGIVSFHGWSQNTYDLLRMHYKLHQLQQIHLCPRRFRFRIAQLLADAPMVHELYIEGRPVLDAEALEGIASGRLGRFLTPLYVNGRLDHAGEWFDMIEARQSNVNSMVKQVSSWRQMFTGLNAVTFWGVKNCTAHKERVAALKVLGTTITLFETRR
jgi:hypothetical protein